MAKHTLPLAPPGGMRDLLPPASVKRSLLRRALMDQFALFGYQRVTTPTFEYADVIERGLHTTDRRDLVRFIEPDTGEVALLRPDITPQIARIAATRLSQHPTPWRLSYEGTVIRRRRGRARRHQQIFQSGVELIGLKGPRADAEVITTAARCARAVGLRTMLIELAQVKIGKALLSVVPGDAIEAVTAQLGQKDATKLDKTLRAAGVKATDRKRLVALTELHGDASVLGQAKKRLQTSACKRALDELQRVFDKVAETKPDRATLGLDLGEVRHQAYYTGVSASLLAAGPGEPIGAGGRYDGLVGQYGAPHVATGFAFDVGNLEVALRKARVNDADGGAPKIVVGGATPRRRDQLSMAFRDADVCAVALDDRARATATRYAKAWSYDGVGWIDGKRVRLKRLVDGRTRALPIADLDCRDVGRWLAGGGNS